MPTLVMETPEGISLSHEIAGAGSRTAAGLVDLALFAVVWLAAALVLLLVTFADETGLSGFFFGLAIGGSLILPALYQILFGILWSGQTPGKRLMGLRVTDAHGYPATAMQHVLRGLFWPLEAMVLVFPVPVGLILIVANERRQRLGDLVAGTVVLRDAAASPGVEPYPRDTWSKLPERRLDLGPALASRLDAGDYRFLRSLLGRPDLDDRDRRSLLRASARYFVGKLGLDLEVGKGREDASAILREIYLYLREERRTPPRAQPVTPPAGSGAAARGSAPDPAGPPR